jgi:carboxylesterase type B
MDSQSLPKLIVCSYRVGAPGFFHSTEMNEAGYLPNNGFRDQRTALLWLQKYIGGFGGNPNDVTLMGESAGAVSAAVHLHSEQPLFRRVMLMSGSTLLKGPAPMAVADVNYQKASKVLNLDSLTPQGRVHTLVNMDGQQLRATLLEHSLAPLVALPLVDGDICPVGVDFKTVMDGSLSLPGRHWCESVLLGDCEFDVSDIHTIPACYMKLTLLFFQGSILGLPLGPKKPGIAKTFVASIADSLPEQAASKLLTGYDIDASTEDDQAFERVLQFGGDVCFYAPTLAFAQGLAESMPVYVYRFNEPNDWPGPWQGRTTHIHDLTYLFQNFNEFLSGEQSQLAEEFATDVLSYVNGKAPWQSWTRTEKVAKVFATDVKGVKEDVPEQTGRRKCFLDLADEIGFDALSGALGRFMAS